MTAMVLGTVLALGALAFVLYPLFREPLLGGPMSDTGVAPPRMREAVPSAVDALREIEFDHATGKLSEPDYAELRATYTERAVRAMRVAEGVTATCASCGPRPEIDAAYCSECGGGVVR